MLSVRAICSISLKMASILSLRPTMLRELMGAAERALEQHVLLAEMPLLERVAHLHLQLVHVERLAEVIVGAEPHRFDRGVGGRKRRNHDAEDVGIDALCRAEDVDAGHVGHLDVGDRADRIARARAARSPLRPFSASVTSYPSRRSTIDSSSRIDRSSSTTSSRASARVPGSAFRVPGRSVDLFIQRHVCTVSFSSVVLRFSSMWSSPPPSPAAAR